MKKALLIVNLGTPNKPTYFSVFKYLKQFLMDGRVIDINLILRFIFLRASNPLSYFFDKLFMLIWSFDIRLGYIETIYGITINLNLL